MVRGRGRSGGRRTAAGPFSSQPSGPGPVGCFSVRRAWRLPDSLDPYDSDMGALPPVRLGPP